MLDLLALLRIKSLPVALRGQHQHALCSKDSALGSMTQQMAHFSDLGFMREFIRTRTMTL